MRERICGVSTLLAHGAMSRAVLTHFACGERRPPFSATGALLAVVNRTAAPPLLATLWYAAGHADCLGMRG